MAIYDGLAFWHCVRNPGPTIAKNVKLRTHNGGWWCLVPQFACLKVYSGKMQCNINARQDHLLHVKNEKCNLLGFVTFFEGASIPPTFKYSAPFARFCMQIYALQPLIEMTLLQSFNNSIYQYCALILALDLRFIDFP